MAPETFEVNIFERSGKSYLLRIFLRSSLGSQICKLLTTVTVVFVSAMVYLRLLLRLVFGMAPDFVFVSASVCLQVIFRFVSATSSVRLRTYFSFGSSSFGLSSGNEIPFRFLLGNRRSSTNNFYNWFESLLYFKLLLDFRISLWFHLKKYLEKSLNYFFL